MVDIDILSIAQARLINESHWIHSRFVLADEYVAALGYVVLVVSIFQRYFLQLVSYSRVQGIEKSRIQQVDPGFIFTSSAFKSTLQSHATAVIGELLETLCF